MSVRPFLVLVALAATTLASSVAASAQSSPYPLPTPPAGAGPRVPGSPGAHQRGARLRALLAQLDLTSSQRTQIVSMFESFRASRDGANPITRRQLIANIEGVLTPQQVGRLKTLMRQRRHRRAPQPTPQEPSPAATT